MVSSKNAIIKQYEKLLSQGDKVELVFTQDVPRLWQTRRLQAKMQAHRGLRTIIEENLLTMSSISPQDTHPSGRY